MEFIALLSAVTANYKNLDKGEKHFFLKKNNNKKVSSLRHIGRKKSHFFKNKIIPETVH